MGYLTRENRKRDRKKIQIRPDNNSLSENSAKLLDFETKILLQTLKNFDTFFLLKKIH